MHYFFQTLGLQWIADAEKLVSPGMGDIDGVAGFSPPA
jgi:hypothetical protein